MNKIVNSGPGRPREFDLTSATEKALEVFRAYGYSGTSLPDLLEGTNLSRGSLYKAFGDKHALFLAALEFYSERGITRLRNDLDKASSRDALRNALMHYSLVSSGAEGIAGCPITSAATECLPHDEEVAKRVRSMFARMKKLLSDTIRRGQLLGEISADQSAEDLGRFLLCLIEGLRVVGKSGSSERETEAVIDIALSRLF